MTRASSVQSRRFARSLDLKRQIEITLGVLAIAKRPEASFDAVWDIPGGFRVRKGLLGQFDVLTWQAAAQLVAEVRPARKPAGAKTIMDSRRKEGA